ncbi:hypothetical protein CROQUDRAFT_44345 [Cronartium quercuum f. sp. fusiforme G11]|uniref:DNA endonuclease activator Ctp1 C-terminal domain-containing protein n=1 Tax=Cronartium quercuum f. sp. fusiforme G11 TaxID=708437 RepID=A0A9P6TBP7_9BASI|nr:hypothetical protein CROQUDRAFT_44345 [Cronartium quercuum f. sp. fusiforme G11]
MDTSDIQDCEQSPKRTKGHDSSHKAAATAPRLRAEEQESVIGKKQYTSPRTSKVITQLTSPKLSRRRSRGRSVSRSPRGRVLTTASVQYPLVCRDLGLPPTPYAPRRIRHSSPISPARLQQAQLLPDTPDQNHKTKHKVKAAEEGSTAWKRHRKSRRESDEPVPVEEYPGQNFMRRVHKKRKEDLERSIKKGQQDRTIGPKPSTSEASRALMSRFEIDPEGNFGVGHVFNEVARGKEVRKQMHGADCECCSGYYEQVAKDFNQPLEEVQKQMAQHKNEISRHRHFNPPPATPPYYWQMGFPDTQQVEIINREADEKKRRKLAMVEAQARLVSFIEVLFPESLSFTRQPDRRPKHLL